MGIEEFRDDDRGYLSWLASHDGYVVNIQRGLKPSDARLHAAGCYTITGEPARGKTWTGPYIKICSTSIRELDDWAVQRVGAPLRRCGACQLEEGGGRRPLPPRDRPRSAASHAPDTRPPGVDAFEVLGPLAGRPMVEAWIDDYVRFQRRPPEQEELRDELRTRVRQLDAERDEVLHATYFGPKHPAADVENLALYNIDDTGQSFADAARWGLRFELAPQPDWSPTGRQYAYGYSYALVRREAGFTHWIPGRRYAEWGWIDLGRFEGEKRLEQVWLALVRTAIDVSSIPRSPDTPFAVHVTVRPPRGRRAVFGYLVKSVVDGVVAAFQAHTDASTVAEVSARVAQALSASPQEIEALLQDQEKAVLGVTRRLLHARGAGVQWAGGRPLRRRGVAGRRAGRRDVVDAREARGASPSLTRSAGRSCPLPGGRSSGVAASEAQRTATPSARGMATDRPTDRRNDGRPWGRATLHCPHYRDKKFGTNP